MAEPFALGAWQSTSGATDYKPRSLETKLRINIYAEEITDRIEVVRKTVDGIEFTGLRFYLYMPVTLADGRAVSGPFIHREGDDDSSAVTFWGKPGAHVQDLLTNAQSALDEAD